MCSLHLFKEKINEENMKDNLVKTGILCRKINRIRKWLLLNVLYLLYGLMLLIINYYVKQVSNLQLVTCRHKHILKRQK